MKKKIVGILVCMLLIYASTTLADWEPGDDHKMHFPQLPDPNGWDVMATNFIALADDWMCSETGPVTDIHFWGSWWYDNIGTIDGFWISIHSNIPEDPPYYPSMPGAVLWSRYITDFNVVPWEPSLQGWYNPETGEFLPENHVHYFQYNIVDITDPFIQQNKTIYWLSICANVTEYPDAIWGWKSSIDHFMDDAFGGYIYDGNYDWMEELYEPPDFVQSLDLAFVITNTVEEECCIEIVNVTGGLLDPTPSLKVNAVVKNTGTAECKDVDWDFNFTGMIWLGPANGTIPSIPPGGTKTVTSKLVIGIALPVLFKSNVTVTANAPGSVCPPSSVTKNLLVLGLLFKVT